MLESKLESKFGLWVRVYGSTAWAAMGHALTRFGWQNFPKSEPETERRSVKIVELQEPWLSLGIGAAHDNNQGQAALTLSGHLCIMVKKKCKLDSCC